MTTSAFEASGDDPWAFHAVQSIVNLNTYYNLIDEGLTKGQVSFTNQIDGVAKLAFPYANPQIQAAQAIKWTLLVLSLLLAFVPGIGPAATAARGLGTIIGGASEVVGGISGDPLAMQLAQEMYNIEQINNYSSTVYSDARQAIETWAENTFAGRPDGKNNDILDYFEGGPFVNGAGFPTISDIESFSSKQLISRLINAGWSTQKIFVTRMETDDPNDKSGPSQGRYYSPEEKAVYYLYRQGTLTTAEDGEIKGHVEPPFGLDKLRGAPYFISGEEITKASAGAWRFAPLNYTYDQGISQIIGMALNADPAVSPFKEGAGFSGTFTIPVCDMGKRNFNSQWTKASKRGVSTGKLPCCCGPDCRDTAAFVKAANMLEFQTLLISCKTQFKNEYPELNIDNIDYGYKLNSKYKNFDAINSGHALKLPYLRALGCLIVWGTIWHLL